MLTPYPKQTKMTRTFVNQYSTQLKNDQFEPFKLQKLISKFSDQESDEYELPDVL